MRINGISKINSLFKKLTSKISKNGKAAESQALKAQKLYNPPKGGATVGKDIDGFVLQGDAFKRATGNHFPKGGATMGKDIDPVIIDSERIAGLSQKASTK